MTEKQMQFVNEIEVSIDGPSVEELEKDAVTKYNYSFGYFEANTKNLLMTSDMEVDFEFEDDELKEDIIRTITEEVPDKNIELKSFEYNWAEGSGSAKIYLNDKK